MWHLLFFSPPTFFVCIHAYPDSHSLYSYQHFFPKLLHSQPLLFWLCHSYLYKVVSSSFTYGVNQQCPLKDDRIWGKMLRHSWTWRTTSTSPRICFDTLRILYTYMCDYKYLTDLVSFKLLSLNLWNSKSCPAHVTKDEKFGHTPQ